MPDLTMTQDKVTIKGTSDGLRITIGSGSWQSVYEAMEAQLGQRAAFFKGGRVSISVGRRVMDTQQFEDIGELLTSQQMSLWAVNSDSDETRATAQSLGLEVETTMTKPVDAPRNMGPMTTTTVRRTLRSGQSIEHPGHVVIVGDVNPGAKVVAGGHIIVWGKLRGTAYAGAIEPEDAFVCALELAPTQLSIGNAISRSPNEDRRTEVIPEMAVVQEGQIVAESWP